MYDLLRAGGSERVLPVVPQLVLPIKGEHGEGEAMMRGRRDRAAVARAEAHIAGRRHRLTHRPRPRPQTR